MTHPQRVAMVFILFAWAAIFATLQGCGTTDACHWSSITGGCVDSLSEYSSCTFIPADPCAPCDCPEEGAGQ